MRLIEKRGQVEIWEAPLPGKANEFEYLVYGVYESGDPRVCPSKGMAYEVAAFS